MNMFVAFISKSIVGLLCVVAACKLALAEDRAAQQYADTIFKNVKAYTINPAQPWANALAMKDGRIVYVGSMAGVEALRGGATEVLDLQGRVVMPGFVSAHDHLVSSLWLLSGVQLFDVTSIEQALQRVKEYADAHPDKKIIRGIGWTMSTLGRYPTAKELDRAVPDRPAFLIDYTGHDGWLNSAAMAAGGIDKNTADRQPGTSFWVRDETGQPTGVAVELEWMPPFIAAGAWQPEQMMRASTRQLFALAASHGVTAFQDTGLITPTALNPEWMKEDFRIAASMLAGLLKEGELPLRVQIMPMLKVPEANLVDLAEFTADMMNRYDTDRLRVRSLKVHPAANMESYGSPFVEPYAGKSTHGHFGISPKTIKEIMLQANRLGVDVVLHAWGDAEVRAGIDAIESSRNAGNKNARNSLHHLGFVHPDDYQRIVDLDIPINVTPTFSTDWSGQDEIYSRLLGEERVFAEISLYPNLARDGVNVSISADLPSSGPFETQAPLYQVAAAVTLRTPMDGERSKAYPPGRTGMTLEQALRAVTIDAAWQLRMEDKIGSLEVGKYADLVILEQNPFEVAPSEIHKIRVLGTLLEGEFTFREAEL